MRRFLRPKLQGGIHICGCGHSGTSILTRLIGAHSRIYAIPGETGIARRGSYTSYAAGIKNFEQKVIESGAGKWVEKTPKHIRSIRFILDCAPSTKIVLISRNPKDAVGSLKRRYGNLEKSLARWKADNRRALYWSRNPQCKIVLYENLVTNTRETLSEVMVFLGFNFEDSQLDFHRQPLSWYSGTADGTSTGHEHPEPPLNESEYGASATHNKYRDYQINQPLFNAIGSYRTHLSDNEAAKVWMSCRNLALALGYQGDIALSLE